MPSNDVIPYGKRPSNSLEIVETSAHELLSIVMPQTSEFHSCGTPTRNLPILRLLCNQERDCSSLKLKVK